MILYKENDIFLVNPTGGWDTKKGVHYFYPISLLYLQSYLKKNNIPSKIIDVKPMKLSPKNFKKLIQKENPKIIAFTGSPFERSSLYEYIYGIKKYAPNTVVIVG